MTKNVEEPAERPRQAAEVTPPRFDEKPGYFPPAVAFLGSVALWALLISVTMWACGQFGTE